MPLATPEEAAAYPFSSLDREMARQRFADQAIGSPETVERQLAGLLERTGADELMLTTQVYDIGDRIHSLELVADKVAGGLARQPPARRPSGLGLLNWMVTTAPDTDVCPS